MRVATLRVGEDLSGPVVVHWEADYGRGRGGAWHRLRGTTRSGQLELAPGPADGGGSAICLLDHNGRVKPLTPQTTGWDGRTQVTSRSYFLQKLLTEQAVERAEQADCSLLLAVLAESEPWVSGDVAVHAFDLERNELAHGELPTEGTLTRPRKWAYLAVSPVLSVIDIPIATLMLFAFLTY